MSDVKSRRVYTSTGDVTGPKEQEVEQTVKVTIIMDPAQYRSLQRELVACRGTGGRFAIYVFKRGEPASLPSAIDVRPIMGWRWVVGGLVRGLSPSRLLAVRRDLATNMRDVEEAQPVDVSGGRKPATPFSFDPKLAEVPADGPPETTLKPAPQPTPTEQRGPGYYQDDAGKREEILESVIGPSGPDEGEAPEPQVTPAPGDEGPKAGGYEGPPAFWEHWTKAAEAMKRSEAKGDFPSRNPPCIKQGHPRKGYSWRMWIEQAKEEGRRNGIDPALILAVIDHESGGDPGLQNPKSAARGLMQLMPTTAGAAAVKDPNILCDGAYNVKVGARHLTHCMHKSKAFLTALHRRAWDAHPGALVGGGGGDMNTKPKWRAANENELICAYALYLYAVGNYGNKEMAEAGDMGTSSDEVRKYIPDTMGRYRSMNAIVTGKGEDDARIWKLEG